MDSIGRYFMANKIALMWWHINFMIQINVSNEIKQEKSYFAKAIKLEVPDFVLND